MLSKVTTVAAFLCLVAAVANAISGDLADLEKAVEDGRISEAEIQEDIVFIY